MKKRILALMLAGVMMLALCACTGSKNSGGTATTDPLTKDDVIDITITSHPSWPYLEDWKVWEYIEEGTGVTLNVTCIPGADAATKYPLMFAARDTLSDVVSFTYKPDTEKYVSQGALVALDDMAQYILPSVSHSKLLNVRNQQITISYLLICAIEDKHIRRCADMAVDNKQRCEYLRMSRKYPELLRIEQLCEALGGISTKTGYKLLRERRINSLKVGREYRVTKVDLINYLMK